MHVVRKLVVCMISIMRYDACASELEIVDAFASSVDFVVLHYSDAILHLIQVPC